MDNETLIEVAKHNKETYAEVEKLNSSILKVDSYIDKQWKEIMNQSTLHTEFSETSQYGLNLRIVNLFNKLLINLVSKRIVFKIGEGTNDYLAFGQSGISCDKKYTSYYSSPIKMKNMRFDYFPSSYNQARKSSVNRYLKTLAKYGSRIDEYIHKKDKKEILSICTKFSKEYLALSEGTHIKQECVVGYSEFQWIENHSYRHLNNTIQTIRYDNIIMEESHSFISIRLYHGSDYITAINFHKDMDGSNRSKYIAIREQNPKTLRVLEDMCKKVKAQNEIKRRKVEQLEEKLKGYILLELF